MSHDTRTNLSVASDGIGIQAPVGSLTPSPESLDLAAMGLMIGLGLMVGVGVWGLVMLPAVTIINLALPVNGVGKNDWAYFWPLIQPTSGARQFWWIVSAVVAAATSIRYLWLYIKTAPRCDDEDDRCSLGGSDDSVWR